jgi:hypothetical protein
MKIKMILMLMLVPTVLTACTAGPSAPCPPKSDTQVIADTISDILVPKIRIGCQ